MKKAYCEFVCELKRVSKDFGVTPDKLVSIVKDSFQGCDSISDHNMLGYLSVSNQLAYLKGDCTHVFLSREGFSDWLCSCARKVEPQYVNVIRETFHERICIHFPTKENKVSFMLVPASAGRNFGFFVILSYSQKNVRSRSAFICFDGTDAQDPFISKELSGFERETFLWIQTLVCGLALYISAFPKTIRDGLPDDAANRNHFRNMVSRTVGVCAEVTHNGTHHSVSPHYRVGHFCVLKSDRYTNKRNAVIFRQGCFVLGKAKTVGEEITSGGMGHE